VSTRSPQAYAHHYDTLDDVGWPEDIFTKCRSGASWPYALVLSLPALSRLIQCLKRYYDSQLKIHLINVCLQSHGMARNLKLMVFSIGWEILLHYRSTMHVRTMEIKGWVIISCSVHRETVIDTDQSCCLVGSKFHDASFIVWVIVAIITSTYTSAWDLIVDWSLFRPESGFLRKDLGYSHRYVSGSTTRYRCVILTEI
jgi:hypothetical protein